MPTTCGVCKTEPSKYKCPSCQLPYCSLICFKPHKASHFETNHNSRNNSENSIFPESTPQPVDGQSYQTSSTSPDLSAIAHHPLFQSLIKRYPQLRSDLHHVYTATQEPPRVNNGRSFHNGTRGSTTTLDAGEEHALKRLRWLKSAEGPRGEAFREFITLVTMLEDKQDTLAGLSQHTESIG